MFITFCVYFGKYLCKQRGTSAPFSAYKKGKLYVVIVHEGKRLCVHVCKIVANLLQAAQLLRTCSFCCFGKPLAGSVAVALSCKKRGRKQLVVRGTVPVCKLKR